MADTQYGFRGMPRVDQSRFAIVPAPGVERSVFSLGTAHKTTFDAGYLVPVYVTEVLPGDSFKVQMTALCRMATPVFPVMDNLYLDSFFFFVPYRLLWDNWQKFMGERSPDPTSSIDYLIPQIDPAPGGAAGNLYDYFGLPNNIQLTGSDYTISALPFRAYNLIWNEWFRDQNLQNSVAINTGDGPDDYLDYNILRRGKRYDYFTSSLTTAQKGDAVAFLPDSATVKTAASNLFTGVQPVMRMLRAGGGNPATAYVATQNDGRVKEGGGTPVLGDELYPSNLYADLSEAAGATINTLRTAVALQQFLERDARGGTRYTEIIRNHFGVLSPDARLQRPEYIGGGSSPVTINPVAQTSESGTTPLGNLGGVGMGVAQHGCTGSFTEHGIIIGMVSVRADLTYQQGTDRFWSRQTRHDFFWPDYAYLGEQEVLRKEIFTIGDDAFDNLVFGYQERYAEYRFHPSKVTGMFRSGIAGSLDAWHLAQEFATAPVLGDTFIQDNPPMERILAGGALTENQQFLFDSVFSVRAVRPIPMYGTPGLLRL